MYRVNNKTIVFAVYLDFNIALGEFYMTLLIKKSYHTNNCLSWDL